MYCRIAGKWKGDRRGVGGEGMEEGKQHQNRGVVRQKAKDW